MFWLVGRRSIVKRLPDTLPEKVLASAKDGSLRPVTHRRTAATAILGALSTVGVNNLTAGRPRRRDGVVVDGVVEDLVADRLVEDLVDVSMGGLES